MPGPPDVPEQPQPGPSRVLSGHRAAAGTGVGPVIPLPAGNTPARPGIVIARDVTPAEVAGLDPGEVLAIATAEGAPLAHASILARAMGIPTVTGLGEAVLGVAPGTTLVVDGHDGIVVVDPSPEEVATFRARDASDQRKRERAAQQAGQRAVTVDGRQIGVLANVGGAREARQAMDNKADGIGMLRTEVTFLDRGRPPSVEEHLAAYREVADALGPRPLVIRTLDLGADIPAWDAPAEANPALGNRGLRLCATLPSLLTDQLRAIVGLAAQRPVQVMFPMVTTLDELLGARRLLDGVRHELGLAAQRLEVGMAVEVPAAALTAEAFARHVDFFAVGTNDLTQYTMAADRTNPAVAVLADGMHPAVLRLVEQVTSVGERHNRPVELVGELGCDREAIGVLLGLGVTALSVRPNAVAEVKEGIRAISIDRARDLAQEALVAESAGAVRRLAREATQG